MKMVRHTFQTLPQPTEQDEIRLQKLAQLPDEQIDFSDIPETTPEMWVNAVRGGMYRPNKQQVTTKIDADVLAWLKSNGKGYQTRINAILREAMLQELATK